MLSNAANAGLTEWCLLFPWTASACAYAAARTNHRDSRLVIGLLRSPSVGNAAISVRNPSLESAKIIGHLDVAEYALRLPTHIAWICLGQRLVISAHSDITLFLQH